MGKGTLLPEKLSLLRQKLSQKAKQEPKFRFYALYDRIYRADTLRAGWELVRKNKGAPGVDGVSIQLILDREGGPEGFLEELQESLRNKTYRPQSVRRGVHCEGKWEGAATGYSHSKGPGGADGDTVNSGADL